jgi:hypothetical protein
MKRTKFFGIGIALLACVLAVLLAAEAGFVSLAWAGKPRTYRTEYGYAMLLDGYGDAIKSDGLGQYVDCTKEGGEDIVELQIYNDDNSLRGVEVYCGKMTYNDPTFPASTRRVNFHFNIDGGVRLEPAYTENKAVYDILLQYKDGANYVTRSSESGFLDDNSVHAPIIIYATEGRVQFVVDPGYEGTDPKAITQATVDAFYGDDKNVNYWDTSEYGEAGQIIYTLYYGDNGFDVFPVDWKDGKPITWVLTTINRVIVKLGVGRHGGKGGKGAHEVVYLSEYNTLPFQLIVSLQSLAAPSTTWGEIKGK